ncbi:hypothetical protein pb186bvf_006664 [Paramecium bursaria]
MSDESEHFDSDTESYKQRNTKIKQFQQTLLAKNRDQMNHYVNNSDFEEFYKPFNPISPQPVKSGQQYKQFTQQVRSPISSQQQKATPKSRNINQSFQQQNQSFQKSFLQLQGSVTPKKSNNKSFTTTSPILNKKEYIVVKAPSKINVSVQTDETQPCRFYINQRRIFIYLCQDNDTTYPKYVQTTGLYISQDKIQQSLKKDEYELQRKREKINKIAQLKTQPGNQYQSTKIKKISNDQTYFSQTIWAQQNQNKLWQKRLEKEEQLKDQEQHSYRPQLCQQSIEIVQKKFNNSTIDQRFKVYRDVQAQKKIERFLTEQEQMNSSRFRMSPNSRKIMKSVTPKHYEFSNNSFSATNASHYQ